MELVLDANILFSALIKSGATRELMLAKELRLRTPEFIISEFLKYIDLIASKTGVEPKQLKILMLELLTQAEVEIIPISELKPFLEKAKQLSPDPDDAIYLALALRSKCGVWSNDKALKMQDEIEVYSTKDLLKLFSDDV